jgi:hypothetical protein
MHLAGRSNILLALAGFGSLLGAHIDAQEAPQTPAPLGFSAERAVELTLSAEAVGIGFRTLFDSDDALRIGAVLDEDEDWGVDGRWLHHVLTVSEDVPVSLALGLAGHLIAFDRPDAEIYALAAAGSAEIPFPTDLPSRFALDLAFAPDLTTFDDGDEVTDVGVRLELDVTERATLFLGYREIEAEFEGRGEKELDGHLGVGLRFEV